MARLAIASLLLVLLAGCATTGVPPAPRLTTEAGKACLRACQVNYATCLSGTSALGAQENARRLACGEVLGQCYQTCQ